MDTTITQVGNNIANQFLKPSDLKDADDTKNNAAITSVAESDKSDKSITRDNALAVKDAKDIKVMVDEADIDQRERFDVELKQALNDISEFMQNRNTQLAFSVDEATNRTVVTVKEAGSGDVIRQIPSEEVLKFAERINELQSEFGSSAGMLLRGQA
jgi:flagellar protein FlaG